MLSWQDFIKEYVMQWRLFYGRLDEESRRNTLKPHSYYYLLTEPLQVEILTFAKAPKVLLIYTRDKERKDLEVNVHLEADSDVKSYFSKMKKENVTWFKRFEGIKTAYEMFYDGHSSSLHSVRDEADDYWYHMYREFSIENEDPRRIARREVTDITRQLERETESSAIGKKAEEIKNAAEQVLDKNQRYTLLKAAEDIQTSLSKLKRLEEHDKKIAAIEGEIAGVRKLIGTSKEYQDWKVLVEDVADFKKTPHVAKELFESEIKRLDQRIDGLKEIKFWSKRTVLDVGLAALATTSTIIAALLGAGIIHF